MNALRRRGLALALARAAVLALAPVCMPAALAVQSDDADDERLRNDADCAAGREALRAGDAAAALRRFEAALKRFPDSADVHNELGFTHSKLRRLDEAFEHYKRALAIKPDHRGAHVYIGVAYLMAGDLPGAERHMAELRRLCLLPCKELKELEQAVSAYKATGQRSS